jgi:hypothetical protein
MIVRAILTRTVTTYQELEGVFDLGDIDPADKLAQEIAIREAIDSAADPPWEDQQGQEEVADSPVVEHIEPAGPDEDHAEYYAPGVQPDDEKK